MTFPFVWDLAGQLNRIPDFLSKVTSNAWLICPPEDIQQTLRHAIDRVDIGVKLLELWKEKQSKMSQDSDGNVVSGFSFFT